MTAEVELVEVLKNKKRYGDFSKKCMSYIPDKATITLEEANIGIKRRDDVNKRYTKIIYNFHWYPFLTADESLYIIGKAITEHHSLCLQGKEGFINGIKLLTEYAHLFNKESIDAHGVPINEEIVRDIPNHLLPTSSYWLANESESLEGDCYKYGLKYAILKEVKDQVLYTWYGEKHAKEYSVVPLVKLRHDTIIKLGTSSIW